MRKDVVMSVSLDQDSARVLKNLAEAVSEGNRSQAVRKLIQAAGPVMLSALDLRPRVERKAESR